MINIEFRTLRANEIEVRPSHVKEGKANMLLYIDSRAVVSLLNETVGNMNWQSKLYEARGQLIGEIGIYDDEKKAWIWKSDTGSESSIEAEKGLVSDIYKRVLSRWGIQELYTAPRITIPDDGYGNSGYRVSEILYNEQRSIAHLVIVNRYGDEVFRWNPDMQSKPIPTASITSTSSTCMVANENKEKLIDSIKGRAEELYNHEGTNREQLKRFVDFYVAKIDKEGWSGEFRFDSLFSRWMSRVFKS